MKTTYGSEYRAKEVDMNIVVAVVSPKLHVISLNSWTVITFPRSMKFIEKLMDEHIETRDSIFTDRENYWIVHQELRAEEGLQMEVTKLKKVLHMRVVGIGVLVAIIVFHESVKSMLVHLCQICI